MSAARHYAKANGYGGGDPQLYETPPAAVRALIEADPWLRRERIILEPACGPGAITTELQRAGHTVISSDKFDYSDRWKGHRHDPAQVPIWGHDFFGWTPAALGPMGDNFAIISNPPYGDGTPGGGSMAARFVGHALSLSPRVYMLLKSNFMHGGQNCALRDALLDGPELTGVFPFRERLTMHRDDFKGRKQGGFFDFAWFRWQQSGVRFREIEFKRVSILSRGSGGGDASSV